MAVRISVRGAVVYYGSFRALDGVTAEFRQGEVAAVLGPNGSGKTTLLRTILRVLKPKEGAVYVDERDLRELKEGELAKLMGYMPQGVEVRFSMRVWEVVALGRKPHVAWALSPRDVQIIEEAMKLVGVERLANRYLHELSGGERQRVMLARVLAQEPKVLLLDEPVSSLDLKYQIEVLKLVRSITREKALVTIASLHDINLALRFADKVVLMKDGSVYAIGRPHEVLTPENIMEVFNVKAVLAKNPRPFIVVEDVVEGTGPMPETP
jgi:iron complex transport system ATP-binding protein